MSRGIAASSPVAPSASTSALRGSRSEVDADIRRLTTLSGGSLGSCVDEERSQLRELM